MKEKLWLSSIIGVLSCYLMSIFWKTLFISSGFSWLAPISPVNTSVFEGLKVLVFPFLLYSTVEFIVIKPYAKQFVAAKASAVFIMPVFAAIAHYSYVFFTGETLVLAETLIIAAAFVVGFASFYGVYSSRTDFTGQLVPAILVILSVIAMFVVFTYLPPKAELFRDPNTDGYGILSYYAQKIVALAELV